MNIDERWALTVSLKLDEILNEIKKLQQTPIKRTLTPEHLARMQIGREKARQKVKRTI